MSRRVWAYATLILGLIPLAFPFYWMIVTALKPSREVFTPTPEWLPAHPAWNNFALAWNAEPFGRFLVNSVIVTAAIVFLQIALAALSAFALARFEFRGRTAFFWIIMAALIVPVQVTFIANFITLAHLGWLNTYAGLIAPYAVSAFGTFLFRQAFLAVPRQLEDAARLDGCSGLAFLWRVLLPLSKPTVFAFALVAVVTHWNSYFWPLIVTTNNSVRTLPIGLGMFIGQEVTTDWNLLMAASLFVSAPMLLLFFLLQRYFVQSYLRGGIRG
jgi:sn-glycerol 3-phosphate transport system permease protein